MILTLRAISKGDPSKNTPGADRLTGYNRASPFTLFWRSTALREKGENSKTKNVFFRIK